MKYELRYRTLQSRVQCSTLLSSIGTIHRMTAPKIWRHFLKILISHISGDCSLLPASAENESIAALICPAVHLGEQQHSITSYHTDRSHTFHQYLAAFSWQTRNCHFRSKIHKLIENVSDPDIKTMICDTRSYITASDGTWLDFLEYLSGLYTISNMNISLNDVPLPAYSTDQFRTFRRYIALLHHECTFILARTIT